MDERRSATLRRLAAVLIAEVRHLDRRIATATTEISAAVAASATTLTGLRGIGDLTAGKILARVGDIDGSAPRRRSPLTPAPPPSRSPPATSCATGCPEPEIAN
jgi:transposase